MLLGALVGVGGTAYFFSIGGGDYLLTSSPRVHRLEEELHRVSQEREQFRKKLEEHTALMEKMATQFADLERRFQALEGTRRNSVGERLPQEGQSETTGVPPE